MEADSELTGLTLRSREDELFARWKAHVPAFYPDGAGQFYEQEPTKLLFVLRDGNKPDDEGDLRYFLDHGERPQTWNNCTRWASAVLDRAEWNDVRTIDEFKRYSILRRVAAVNVKKAAGGSTVSSRTLWKHAIADETNRCFLIEQLGLYSPIVTIAGGTFYILEELFRLDVREGDDCVGKFRFAVDNVLGVVIDSVHPAARKNGEQLFRLLESRLEYLTRYGVLGSVNSLSAVAGAASEQVPR